MFAILRERNRVNKKVLGDGVRLDSRSAPPHSGINWRWPFVTLLGSFLLVTTAAAAMQKTHMAIRKVEALGLSTTKHGDAT